MSTTNFIFTTLKAAEITITDFATLTGVTRQTLHSWKAGNPIKDFLRFNVVYNWATRMDKATEAGKLPLREKIPAAERVGILRTKILG